MWITWDHATFMKATSARNICSRAELWAVNYRSRALFPALFPNSLSHIRLNQSSTHMIRQHTYINTVVIKFSVNQPTQIHSAANNSIPLPPHQQVASWASRPRPLFPALSRANSHARSLSRRVRVSALAARLSNESPRLPALTYTNTYIHKYIHTQIHTYTNTYIRTYTCICIYIYVCIYIYIYMYVYTCVYTHMYKVTFWSSFKRDTSRMGFWFLLQNIVSFVGLFCKRDL